jgi:hypothetical protein
MMSGQVRTGMPGRPQTADPWAVQRLRPRTMLPLRYLPRLIDRTVAEYADKNADRTKAVQRVENPMGVATSAGAQPPAATYIS